MTDYTAGFHIIEGDLVKSIGGGFRPLPVHAYIPMQDDGVRQRPLEEPVVAYRNQMRAKRVADKYRKRDKRLFKIERKFIVMGVTVK